MKNKLWLFLTCILFASCDNNENKVFVLFEEVNTLDLNSKVFCKGIEVGKVDDMILFNDKVLVELSIYKKYKIQHDSKVYIAQNGLIDIGHIEIESTSKSNVFLKPNDTVVGFGKDDNNYSRKILDLIKNNVNTDSIR